ncbi:hypothetical protein ELE36_18435 [Pseudolysobacter antarcticus]|uniref:Uncharacterized protein n=1 Tax=Pseudolysobacter antarcticus TaxID=2511995 RepID=A0A411HNZ3_9GAMM|nr:hypothetical protein [Pseudolysobacter antarcticus]QBB72182.1 hypothetical protein ELE36_18435 [Pseudolysobacter antarcticus]
MQRIEPTFGSAEPEKDQVALTRARAIAKSRRTRKAILDWLVTVLIAFATIALCVACAWYAGVIPDQYKFGTPKLFERSIIVIGFIVVLGSQLVGSILMFNVSFVQGGLSLFVPGYIYIALRRNKLYVPVMGTWFVGLLAIVVGTILLA